MQRNATQRNATQRNATQRNATQRNATQRNATQRNATQRNATQRNATQYNTSFTDIALPRERETLARHDSCSSFISDTTIYILPQGCSYLCYLVYDYSVFMGRMRCPLCWRHAVRYTPNRPSYLCVPFDNLFTASRTVNPHPRTSNCCVCYEDIVGIQFLSGEVGRNIEWRARMHENTAFVKYESPSQLIIITCLFYRQIVESS